MRRAIGVVVMAMALALVDAAPVRAQFLPGPGFPSGYCHTLAFPGFGFPHRGPGLYGAAFVGGYYSRSVFLSPVNPPWSVVPPISTLTPFGWSPGFLPAGWGVGPGWGWFAPPIVVVQPPIVLAGGNT